jgi:hypothetical protein
VIRNLHLNQNSFNSILSPINLDELISMHISIVRVRFSSRLFKGFVTGLLTLLLTVGIYTSFGEAIATAAPTTYKITSLSPTGSPVAGEGWEVTSKSGKSELALAVHLKKIGAKMYGTYWCPHCYEQKQLFGREAVKKSVQYIECAEDGIDPQVEVCRAAGIQGFPTWDIKGEKYPGVRAPEELAKLSSYRGNKNFRYSKLLR